MVGAAADGEAGAAAAAAAEVVGAAADGEAGAAAAAAAAEVAGAAAAEEAGAAAAAEEAGAGAAAQVAGIAAAAEEAGAGAAAEVAGPAVAEVTGVAAIGAGGAAQAHPGAVVRERASAEGGSCAAEKGANPVGVTVQTTVGTPVLAVRVRAAAAAAAVTHAAPTACVTVHTSQSQSAADVHTVAVAIDALDTAYYGAGRTVTEADDHVIPPVPLHCSRDAEAAHGAEIFGGNAASAVEAEAGSFFAAGSGRSQHLKDLDQTGRCSAQPEEGQAAGDVSRYADVQADGIPLVSGQVHCHYPLPPNVG